MKKLVLIAALFLMLANNSDVQGQTDSLRIGRNCKIVLFNGFQSEGRIVNRKSDTITLQTDITNLFIPVKDIKFIMDPEAEVSDIAETDTPDYNRDLIDAVKIDTSGRCDIYLQDKSLLSNVMLVTDTDSTLKILKENRTEILKIAGIRKIVFRTTAPFGKGYLIGSAIGVGVSFLTIMLFSMGSADVYHYIVFTTLGSIPFGIIGGLFGELFSKDDIYLFNKGIYPQKIKIIKDAIGKHT